MRINIKKIKDEGIKEKYGKEIYDEMRSIEEERKNWSMKDGTFLKIRLLK